MDIFEARANALDAKINFSAACESLETSVPASSQNPKQSEKDRGYEPKNGDNTIECVEFGAVSLSVDTLSIVITCWEKLATLKACHFVITFLTVFDTLDTFWDSSFCFVHAW